jgi:hypothetical protein
MMARPNDQGQPAMETMLRWLFAAPAAGSANVKRDAKRRMVLL